MLGIFISRCILSMIKLVGMGINSKIYGTQSTTAQNKIENKDRNKTKKYHLNLIKKQQFKKVIKFDIYILSPKGCESDECLMGMY